VENVLPRLEEKIDKNDFMRLLALHRKHKWLEDAQDGLFDLWTLADNDSQKKLIEGTLGNFTHVDSSEMNKIGKSVSNHIESVWGLTSKDTFLVAMSDDNRPDGSQAFIQSLKNKFSYSWKESNFFNSLPVAAHNIVDNSNVVLVDDFIGTGNTLTRKHKYITEKFTERNLKNVTIKVVTIATLEIARQIIQDMKLDCYSQFWLKKGISDLVPEEERETALISMVELENKLKKKIRGRPLPNFGYKRSEALYALESYNIPNNVFPIFWWPFLKGGNARSTIFRRL
jgi:hypothetical protein